MPRITKPLSDTEIRQARPKEKEHTLWDGKGLCVRVSAQPKDTKSWIFSYYRPHTGKRANISLGLYPTVSLAAARRTREEYLELLSQKIDPAHYRAEQKRAKSEAHANTLRKVAEKWFAIKRSRVSEAYAADIWRSLESHIFPKLGDTPLHQIKPRHVIEVLKPVAAKGALETVRRMCQRVNDIMDFAVISDLIDSNPLTMISKAFESPTKENMPSLKPEELPVLMQTLARASIKLTTRCLIEWQLQTMVRPGEAAGTRWEEIDFEKKTWTIPAERMKKKRPHVVPLTPQSLALLEVMKPISRNEYVFPSDRNPRTHTNEQTANMALKRMGFGGRLVAHGLRSLASTILNDVGHFDPDVIEAALAHTDKNEVRAAYNRAQYLKRRRDMMNWWSDHIVTAAAGNMSLGAVEDHPAS